MHYFSNLFDKVLYMFRKSPLSIIRSISTLYTRNTRRYLSCKSCWRLIADANRTCMTNSYCVFTVLRYSWWWTVELSETYRVLYQINLRNSASRWLLLWEYTTIHDPLNVKIFTTVFGDGYSLKTVLLVLILGIPQWSVLLSSFAWIWIRSWSNPVQFRSVKHLVIRSKDLFQRQSTYKV